MSSMAGARSQLSEIARVRVPPIKLSLLSDLAEEGPDTGVLCRRLEPVVFASRG